MSIIIDGDQAYKVFSPEHGAVNVALRWFSADARGEEKPAMFIYPKPHVKREGSGAFVIPLANAWQYQALDLAHKDDLAYAIQSASDAAMAMKLDVNKSTISNICDVIFNYLPELIAMPPKRMIISKKDEPLGAHIGEMAIKLDGNVIHEQEVTAP